ncbi:SCAN domain-containing protein 3-like [Acyrthosiphon pisum]|uniref:HAT C-terminal dimerisation domain-containing protein n=1 Tax=Acyrthosiphon pisum TaxID=7029 RepID=A0A8R2JMJ4_ACYPI|nr:SCAN domain-containing protein 3-like [Acyrthosiphon pisum]
MSSVCEFLDTCMVGKPQCDQILGGGSELRPRRKKLLDYFRLDLVLFIQRKLEIYTNKYLLSANVFSTNVDTLPDTFQEQAIELKNDLRAKIDLNSGSSLEEFWVKYQPIYPEISNEALQVLVQFSSTYLCESGFSSLAIIKTKHRNCLDVESDLRCSLSNIEPNFKKLSKEKCCQPSH